MLLYNMATRANEGREPCSGSIFLENHETAIKLRAANKYKLVKVLWSGLDPRQSC